MTSAADHYIATADIRAAVKGHEAEILDGLGIPWRDGRPYIRCPYSTYPDNHPSWRWDDHNKRACCSCTPSASIFDVIMNVEGIGFEAAKLRLAEILKRTDLVRERRAALQRREGDGIPPEQHCNGATPLAGCSLAAYAKAKHLPIEFLQTLGVSEINYLGSPALRLPYFDLDDGEPVIRFRVSVTGDGRFRWKRGAKPRLYGLNRLAQARAIGHVALVEGESDCHTFWFHRFPALGLPGAGNWKEDRDARLLDGIDVVYLVVEPDRGGTAMIRWLAQSCIRGRVWLIRLDGFKDPSALFLDNPERFPQRWRAALDAAEPYQVIADRESAVEAGYAKEGAGDLIFDPNILRRFADDLVRAGLVGEDRNAKLLYLTLTTRLFASPVSVVIKGPSSGGKSYTVEVVLRFFPSSAYWERTSMSDRALAYSDEDFRHRHLVIYEAAGMTSDIASYLIRTLLSEGRIRHELVEETADGMRARVIEKEGPTGLIVTTTAARLHPENETRLLSLAVVDTAEQTKAIFHLLADGQDRPGAVDYDQWRAVQIWLATGERRVTAPFARPLADLIRPVAVRLRRDFRLLLALIQAHALLHRERRQRDAQGRIVATLGDYASVRDLVADLFSEGVEATVKPSTREAVAAVATLGKEEVSLTEIGRHLRLDKGAASRRVADAIVGGYLVNREDRRGRPARIALGDPLPAETEILPLPEQVLDRCSVAALAEGIDTPSPPTDCDSELAEIEI